MQRRTVPRGEFTLYNATPQTIGPMLGGVMSSCIDVGRADGEFSVNMVFDSGGVRIIVDEIVHEPIEVMPNPYLPRRRAARRLPTWMQPILEEDEADDDATEVMYPVANTADVRLEHLKELQSKDTKCGICKEIPPTNFIERFVTPCGHLFCRPCIGPWAEMHENTFPCPNCRALMHSS